MVTEAVGTAIIAYAQLAAAAAGTAASIYSVAAAPDAPAPPKPPSPPPPPPGVPPPPKKAPSMADASKGVAAATKERNRAFGLEDTIIAPPKLGNVGGSGRRSTTKLGQGGIF